MNFPSKMDRSFQTSAMDMQHLLCTRLRKMFSFSCVLFVEVCNGCTWKWQRKFALRSCSTRTIPYTLSCGVLLMRTLFKEICIWCTAICVCRTHAVHSAEIYNRFSTICARGRHVHVYSLRKSAMGAPHMRVCTLSAVDVP